MKKSLFVSPVQPIAGSTPNVYNWDKEPNWLDLSLCFLNHPGLKFLQANTGCGILEYPDEKQYLAALKETPEVLGISFYINETDIVLKMVEQARAAGVKEIWGGNLGAYTPGLEKYFDRLFQGWGEQEVAEALDTQLPKERVSHPEMYCSSGIKGLGSQLAGILFTSRGCPWTCNFCQTPDFYDRANVISLESIEEVLWKYHQQGIKGINILDENFGTFRSHTREVIRLLHKYQMRWIALSRTDTLLRDFDDWAAHGMNGAHIGIESLNQEALKAGKKRLAGQESVRLLKMMSHHNMFVQAFYILGFETDTEHSIREDIELLAQLDIDLVQVQVLTPYPRTGQRQEIEKEYGIHDKNLSHYNSRNLVWRHPNISPETMRELQIWANQKLRSPAKTFRTIAKQLLSDGRPGFNIYSGFKNIYQLAWRTRGLRKQLKPHIDGANAWAKTSWYPYEEVQCEMSGSRELNIPKYQNQLKIVEVR